MLLRRGLRLGPDGTRELADGRAREFQRQQEDDLRRRGVDYVFASGTLDERSEQVWTALRATPWGATKEVETVATVS